MKLAEAEEPNLITAVRFDDARMYVRLKDGREISVPLWWYPRLLQATPEQRNNCEILPFGDALHWPDIDEDLDVHGLLIGAKARGRQSDEHVVPLGFNLRSARDLLGKVKRDAADLDQQVTSDRFFNFVVTAYSLIDWIKNDPAVPPSAKKGVGSLHVKLKVCGELANSSKHFVLEVRKGRRPITNGVTSKRGWGVGRYGRGPYGVGEESIDINLSDGANVGLLEFKDDVLGYGSNFSARTVFDYNIERKRRNKVDRLTLFSHCAR
jgi:hypothetical protein